MKLKIDSEEYKLWCEIVNDVYNNCGDNADVVMDKIEKFAELISTSSWINILELKNHKEKEDGKGSI